MWRKYEPAIFTDDSKQELDREEMWLKVGRGRRGGEAREYERFGSRCDKEDKSREAWSVTKEEER